MTLGNVRFRDSVSGSVGGSDRISGGDRSAKPERYRYRYRWILLHPVRSIPIPIAIPMANALS